MERFISYVQFRNVLFPVVAYYAILLRVQTHQRLNRTVVGPCAKMTFPCA